MDTDFEIVVEELGEDTCWRLLARAGFGRIAFIDGEQPMALPINAGVYDRQVVFRTADGSSLAKKGDGSRVAFEADETDRIDEGGWSVVVRGRLWDVTDSPEVSTWSDFAVRAWAPPPRDRWMLIEPSQVTGRSIERHRKVTPGTRLPYMEPD